jgi:beta,beta-carotene 9',10'-dioxygenase
VSAMVKPAAGETDADIAANHFALGLETLAAEVEVERLPMAGRMPDWLRGSLYRNGPAQFEAGSKKLEHWFDGFGMIHRFEFRGDGVGYRNRYIRSRSFRQSMRDARLFDMQFATNARESWAGNVWSFWKNGLSVTDNTSVSLMPGNRGELIALTEAKHQMRIDATNLNTLGYVEYDDRLKHVIGSAHPHYDYARAETVTYSVNFGRISEYLVHRVRQGSRSRDIVARIPVKRPSYMHSFALTENHAVLTESPLTVNPLAFLFSGRPFIKNYQWEPDRGTVFLVINRNSGQVQRFETAPLFCFHHVNAWEAQGEVCVDLCAYGGPHVIQDLSLSSLRNPSSNEWRLPEVRRYRLDLKGGAVRIEILSDQGLELPRMAYRSHNTHRYRYVYGISTDRTDEPWNSLVRLDTVLGTALAWKQDGAYPGEPVFVPEPGGARENQGVVLSLVLDGARRHSFLLVLDAESFDELGRADLPHAVPYGFHGLYLEDKEHPR